jgi:pilus assembly protein CpaB
MRAKTILSILFLISLGIAVFVILRALPHRVAATAAAPAAAKTEVLVAKVPLKEGTLLRNQDLAWHAIAGQATADEIVRPSLAARQAKPELDAQARAAVQGAALALTLPAGAPIRRSIIVKPGDRDFLRLVLSPGERAIAIPVTTGGAGSGLLSPGDHVDVILTQAFHQNAQSLARSSVSETIVQNLRVLAVKTPDPKVAGNFGPIVTLEVTPAQAEAINVATELGKLSLTLRPATNAIMTAADTTGPKVIKPIWAGDVSPALGRTRPPNNVIADPPPIEVIHGTQTQAIKTQ